MVTFVGAGTKRGNGYVDQNAADVVTPPRSIWALDWAVSRCGHTGKDTSRPLVGVYMNMGVHRSVRTGTDKVYIGDRSQRVGGRSGTPLLLLDCLCTRMSKRSLPSWAYLYLSPRSPSAANAVQAATPGSTHAGERTSSREVGSAHCMH